MKLKDTLAFQGGSNNAAKADGERRQTGMPGTGKDQCKKEPREQKAVEVGEASWSLWTMLRTCP